MVTARELLSGFCRNYYKLGITEGHTITEYTRLMLQYLTTMGEMLGYWSTSEESINNLSSYALVKEEVLKKISTKWGRKKIDLLWFEKPESRLRLICESEMSDTSFHKIRQDATKLSLVKSPLKLQICCHKRAKATLSVIQKKIAQYKSQHIEYAIMIDDWVSGTVPSEGILTLYIIGRYGSMKVKGIAETKLRSLLNPKRRVRTISEPKWKSLS